MTEQESAVLRQAAAWVQTNGVVAPNAEQLRRLAEEHGLDFATAALYQALRVSPRHGPFIARLDELPPEPCSADVEIVTVPGAFYKEAPHTGADGRLVRETAAAFGYAGTIVPLQSFGKASVNAAILADWLRGRGTRPMILVSHSKGAVEMRHLLARPDAPELLSRVLAWVDLSGMFHGTPLVSWLRRHPLRWWLLRLFFWWKGHTFAALNEIDQGACPPWPEALAAVPHLRVIHVVGLPMQQHLTTPLSQRGYRRLSPWGPNDGAILLGDIPSLPGLVYPVWGADHYLRPPGRDMRPLVASILRYLTEELETGPDQRRPNGAILEMGQEKLANCADPG